MVFCYNNFVPKKIVGNITQITCITKIIDITLLYQFKTTQP